MNKTILKSYLNGNKLKPELKTSCYKYNDMYLISDTYSVVLLNDSYNFDVKSDEMGKTLMDITDHFESDYNFDFEDKPITDNMLKNDYTAITENWGINGLLFRKIARIIKADTYNMLENRQQFNPFIIKLKNTKTGEFAYLPACRTF